MKFPKFYMAVCVIAVMIAAAVPSFAEVTETVTGGYTVSGDKYDLIKGVFFFPSAVVNDEGNLIDIPARFFYTDGFFAEDSYTYNNHLATASLCMAMSAFYSNEGDYPTKRKNIIQYMKDIGVAESDIYANRYNTIKPQTDSIGVTIGMKRLSNGKILIPVAIRGSNYELEWVSNVTLGEMGEAEGFGEAANIVFGEVKRYIARKNLQAEISNGNVIFWAAGYSRAGATTNLTAKHLVDEYSAAGNKIFAYGLEPAIGGVASEEKSGFNYNCIHSVVNPADLVPRVAPYAMGFKRYGVDHYIPGSNAGTVQTADNGSKYDNTYYKTTSAEYQTVKSKMLAHLLAVNPDITFTDDFSVLGLGLGNKETKYVFKQGDSMTIDDYLDEFMRNFPAWTRLTRSVYNGGVSISSDRYTVYGNVQRSLRALMSLMYGSNTAGKNVFLARFLSQWKTKSLSKWGELSGFIFYCLREWNNPGFKYKPLYINRVIKWFEDTNSLEAFNLSSPEQEKLLRAELPVVVSLILTLAADDFSNRLHKTYGLTQLATLIGNIGVIGMNHHPEVTLAWLRAQDSLYDNDTARVSAMPVIFSPSDSNVRASEVSVIVDVDDLPDFFAPHGSDPAKQLPSTVTGTDSSGTAQELSVTWVSPKIYALNDTLSGDTWTETNVSLSAGTSQPLLYVFEGTVSGGGITISGDVSIDLTANVYVAGIPRVDPPYSVLPEGEYSGPQSVILRRIDDGDGDIQYSISYFADNDDGSQSGGGTWEYKTYTGPVTVGNEEALTTATEYVLAVRVKSNTATSGDSEEIVYYYKINPAVSEDENSEYTANTTSKIFTLSNDSAVCWSFDIPASLDVFATPADSETIPAKKIDVAVVTIAGATKKGTHKIPVKISADGTTWTDYESITFTVSEAEEESELEGEKQTQPEIRVLDHSSGNCNMSLSSLGLLLSLSGLVLGRRRSA